MHTINRANNPALYAAMDEAAAQYWAYPGEKWQHDFIDAWLASQASQPEPEA